MNSSMKSGRMARIARSYHDGELAGITDLTLSKTASHHLVTVLRSRQGDFIDLFNGDGHDYRASIIDTGQRTPGKCAVLKIHDRVATHTESPTPIELVQAISRGDRMDTTMRQAVELGVSRLQPVYSRYSARALDEKRTEKKMQHWQSIVTSACEQSGRSRLPALAPPVTLVQLLQQWAASDSPAACRFVLSPTADKSLVTHLRAEHDDEKDCHVTVVIGPETGLDADEIEQLERGGAQAVTIGPRILRTETAGPACVALIQATLGDLT